MEHGNRSDCSNPAPRLCFTLETLTDGSEFTGNGTVFLSVWKRPKHSSYHATESGSPCPKLQEQQMPLSCSSSGLEWLEEIMTTTTPLARYAISGLGDATARLCADQRLKLAPTRAVFMPSSVEGIDDDEIDCSGSCASSCWDGLPALLLALHSAGAPSLHIVAPSFKSIKDEHDTSTLLEDLATLVLGNHKDLSIRTCEVPSCASDETTTKTVEKMVMNWWRVYQDEYIVVHSTSVTNGSVFLYSIPLDGDSAITRGNFYTIAVVPPRCPSVVETFSNLKDLPILGCDSDCNSAAKINCILALNPRTVNLQQQKQQMPPLPSVLVTLPDHPDTTKTVIPPNPLAPYTTSPQQDPGLLIRSQQIAQDFHRSMPWAFPGGSTSSATATDVNATLISARNNIDKDRIKTSSDPSHTKKSTPVWTRLRSCTTVLLDTKESIESKANEDVSSQFIIIDRKNEIWDRPKRNDWRNTKDSLADLMPEPLTLAEGDENEIDLDDDEEEEGSSTTNEHEGDGHPKLTLISSLHDPHLLVLGTGCASPSALRGASGYALIFPTSHSSANNPERCLRQQNGILLLDCGEGVTTMLSRHGGGLIPGISQIFGVWISHAHLDHFGGLPTLIRVTRLIGSRASRRRSSPDNSNNNSTGQPPPFKQARLDGNLPPPWVMAPAKVLQLLDLVLYCERGIRRGTNEQWFVPMTHRHHQHNPRDFASLLSSSLMNNDGVRQPPWTWFQNIPVHHSCGPSYGLLLGWNNPQEEILPSVGDPGWPRILHAKKKTQWFCFSGDTRPCQALVESCRHAIRTFPSMGRIVGGANGTPLFLLHEATFQDDDQKSAIEKRHSTISEALRIARDIAHALDYGIQTGDFLPGAPTRVLLTHFSQRYNDFPLPKTASSNGNPRTDDEVITRQATSATNITPHQVRFRKGPPRLVVGLAMDGLWVKL